MTRIFIQRSAFRVVLAIIIWQQSLALLAQPQEMAVSAPQNAVAPVLQAQPAGDWWLADVVQNDTTKLGQYHIDEGMDHLQSGNAEEAIATWQEGWAVCQNAQGLPVLKLNLLYNIYSTYIADEEWVLANKYVNEGFVLLSNNAVPDSIKVIASLPIISHWIKIGNLDEAYRLANSNLLLARQEKLPIEEAAIQYFIGLLVTRQNDYPYALAAFKAAGSIYDSLGVIDPVINVYTEMGSVLTNKQEHQQAIAMYEQVFQLCEENKRYIQPEWYLGIADNYLAQGDTTGVGKWLDTVANAVDAAPDNLSLQAHLYRLEGTYNFAIGDSMKGQRYTRLYHNLIDELNEENQAFMLALKMEEENIRTLTAEVESIETAFYNERRNKRYLTVVLIGLVGLFVGILFWQINQAAQIMHKSKKLHKQIAFLQDNDLLMTGQQEKESGENKLDKEKILETIEGSLNDTDWQLLTALVAAPNLSNRALAEKANISHEGARSSLKKMYRLFDIEGESANKKFALVMAALSKSSS